MNALNERWLPFLAWQNRGRKVLPPYRGGILLPPVAEFQEYFLQKFYKVNVTGGCFVDRSSQDPCQS